MFGYRLLRESDYDRLLDDLGLARLEADTAKSAQIDALIALADAKANAQSRATAVDHLTMSLNTVNLELGQLRSKITGLPTIVPQIGKGNPLSAEGIGAGADLFEDVGDARAKDLADRGLLHDIPAFPSAAALSGAVQE